ncbi:MAG: radical SAM protein [Lachnospiraceae bacterium]|nr:radical SAM protein [Lachnospiraceae bacterium]
MGQELLIELVSNCNLQCRMCAFKHGFTNRKMDNEIVDRIFKDIKEINDESSFYKFTDLRMDGNSEPLLYSDLPFVMKCANEAGINNINITTNGVLLTKERTNQLIQTSLTTLDISMTGIIPEIYKNFQGYGLPDENVIENIEMIKNNVKYFIKQKRKHNKNITVTMRYIITKETQDHFIDYINFFKGIGADAVMGMTLTKTDLRGKCKPYGEIVARRSCESPEHPVICANGDILMAFCPYEIPVMGNYLETSVKEVFMSEKAEKLIDSFRTLKIEDMPENCRNCYNTHVYRGGKW